MFVPEVLGRLYLTRSSLRFTIHNKSVKVPMIERQIITLMHKLFYGDIDTSDGYVHLIKDNVLDRGMFERFVSGYIYDDILLIYVDSQNVFSCTLVEAFDIVKSNYSNGRIRIANKSFNAKIMIEPIGVGVGHLTNKSIGHRRSAPML